LASLSFTKLFVIILHWDIWHLYLLQSYSSLSYTKTFDIFIFYKVIRYHPTLNHLTSLSFTKLFVIILHWNIWHLLSFTKLFVIILHYNIWHLYLLQSYLSSTYTKTFDIFIFYKAIRHHPKLRHLTSLSFTKLFVIILH
jgi:hypothetical protein